MKRDCGMSDIKITHRELCVATAKRFNRKFALYEYKSTASAEEPDVLVFDFSKTVLFEIKMSLSDFRADQYKDCRKKWTLPYWARYLDWQLETKSPFLLKMACEQAKKENKKARFEMVRGEPEIELIEREHLGNRRYFVCPWGIIPVESVPEGWGLLYYKNGKFFLKKESGRFRSNLRTEKNIVIHALRRYASGDSTGILINTYGGEKP